MNFNAAVYKKSDDFKKDLERQGKIKKELIDWMQSLEFTYADSAKYVVLRNSFENIPEK